MKILLIGEFSGLHYYLKQGLQSLGHEVKLFATGDGYKKIPGADGTYLHTWLPGRAAKVIDGIIYPYFCLSKFSGYDVVQFINTRIFNYRNREGLFASIMKRNSVSSLVSAGLDYALVKAYLSGKFDYYIFDYDASYKIDYDENTYKGRRTIRIEKSIVNKFDTIIPSYYACSIGYEGKSNLRNIIPFPINVESIEYRENTVNGKIVFFHGLNREKAKGTPFIIAALQKLKEKYPNEVDIIIDGHMPFSKYIKLISKANVIVDQCCGYGYGINACISMAQGKVVISGCRQETLDAFGIKECPIIPGTPNVDQLYSEMERIVINKHSIPQIGWESRNYVTSFHNYIDIAKKYIDCWKNCQ